MKKRNVLAVYAAAIVLLAACAPSLKVNSDYDKSVDFTKYKTFVLYQSDSSNSAISQLNQERIKNAVIAAMQSKGFTLATDAPDLYVNTVAILKDKVALSSSTNYYGYGGVYRPYYWGGGMGGSSTTSYNVDHYKDGSLIIDVVDAGTKKLLWQGIGNKEIDNPIKNPDVEAPNIVNKIMASFPPGAAKKK